MAAQRRVEPRLTERRLRFGGVETFLYDVGDGDVPTLCLHGNPDSADLWLPLLRRSAELGRCIAPDLPGWGRSRVLDRRAFDGSVRAMDLWLEALLDELGLDRFHLVVHDWGGFGLAAAARRVDRLQSLVVIDAVPLTRSYRWHWVARNIWRRGLVGDLSAKVHYRWLVALVARAQHVGLRGPGRAWRRQLAVSVGPQTADSILRLYRSAEPRELARLGEGLGQITVPALLVRGARDPYIGAADLAEVAARLGGPVEQWEVPAAGHWVMYDDTSVFDRVVRFVSSAG